MNAPETIEQFPIRDLWTNEVIVTAEISVTPDMPPSVKLGLAVKWAVKARANLARANLALANLAGAKNADLAIAKTRILPDGSLIGYKKCRDGVIVKLRIPDDAPRSHAFGRKCRAKFADVLELSVGDVAFSSHDPKFAYRVGERVEALNWSENWQDECAGGVHFFISRAEAEAY